VVMRFRKVFVCRPRLFVFVVPSLCVSLGPVTTPGREPSVGESVSLFREPDAGNLPVRFDEREQEKEPSQTGLRWRGESQVEYPPGDYSYCAFSTLLSITLTMGFYAIPSCVVGNPYLTGLWKGCPSTANNRRPRNQHKTRQL
jgi:hypothetical protein